MDTIERIRALRDKLVSAGFFEVVEETADAVIWKQTKILAKDEYNDFYELCALYKLTGVELQVPTLNIMMRSAQYLHQANLSWRDVQAIRAEDEEE
jgi:hypothetical protein